MLDMYQDIQPTIYKILTNSLLNLKLSHAYLFETNGTSDAYKMAIAFAKSILCPNKYTSNEKCVDCTQCNKIEKAEFSELVIIEPDGLWIKKEQTDYIQRLFETKGVESNRRVYIVNHADRMNTAAANSILKFLEEPEEGIVAILIADNRYQLLETIRSRCQIVSFNRNVDIGNSTLSQIRKNISSNILDSMTDEELQDKCDTAIKFISYYEENRKDILLHMDKLFHNVFNTRDLILLAFDIIILYYRDIIALSNNISNILFTDEKESILRIKECNGINQLIYKIKKIMEMRKLIMYNVNTNLLMDKLILELEKGE